MYFVPGAKYSDELHEGSRAGFAGSLDASLPLCSRLRRFAFAAGLVFDLIDLSIGRGGGVDYASWRDLEGLHLQFLGLEIIVALPSGVMR